MAAQHPASEVIARGILDAVGIPCPDWRLVVLPDDPALGDVPEGLRGRRRRVRRLPAAGQGQRARVHRRDRDHRPRRALQALKAGDGDAIDAQALLKARLVDIFMGDWDRHRKQWRWAKLPGNPLWVPIPEDRDQAFSRYEGLAPRHGPRHRPALPELRAEVREDRRPHLQRLGAGPPPARRRSRARTSSRRRRPSRPSSPTRRSTRRCACMPPEWYAIDGPRLAADLKARRDALPEVAAKYHEHLAGRVDVLPDEPDASGSRRSGARTATWRSRSASWARTAQPGPPTFHRVFDAKETAEVRFYTLDGNDTVKVTGGGKGPKVRMIGGNGDDTLDATGADNAKLSDSEGQNRAHGRGGRLPALRAAAAAEERPLDPAPRLDAARPVGCPGSPTAATSASSSATASRREHYGFRKSAVLDLASSARGLVVQPAERQGGLRGRVFRRENRHSYFGLYAYASGVEVLRFYGFGNETDASGRRPGLLQGQREPVRALPHVPGPASARRASSPSGPRLKYTDSDEDEGPVHQRGQAVRRRQVRGGGGSRRPLVGRPRQHRLPAQGSLRGGARHLLPAGLGRDERLRPGERQRERLPLRRASADAGPSRRGQEGLRDLPLPGGGVHRRGRPGHGRARRSPRTRCAATAPGATSATPRPGPTPSCGSGSRTSP